MRRPRSGVRSRFSRAAYMDVEQAATLGRLDAAAIERVCEEAWPRITTPDELHDALLLLGCISDDDLARGGSDPQYVRAHLGQLKAAGRVARFVPPAAGELWVATERVAEFELAFPAGQVLDKVARFPAGVADGDAALREIVRSRLEGLGPASVEAIAGPFGLAPGAIAIPLAALEQQGIVMRGRFSGVDTEEWCERRLLARIHRYTLKRLRREIEPVTLADMQRFLFRWQGLGDARREGGAALEAVLAELKGLALPAVVWEREVLPARIADYAPSQLDELSGAGRFVWWRPRLGSSARSTVAASPVALVPRGDLPFWEPVGAVGETAEAIQADADDLSAHAARVHAALVAGGALFFADLVADTGLLRVQVEDALGELVARGIVTSDAFSGLRAVISPQRQRPSFGRARRRGPVLSGFDRAGRWTLVRATPDSVDPQERLEHVAMTLLRRYGVVARAIVAREALIPPWRELVAIYRRWEAQGEIRGGRFVGPVGGEQFALTEAVEALRRIRREPPTDEWIVISAADPLNLVIGGQERRIAAVGANRIAYRNGARVAAAVGQRMEALTELDADSVETARQLLRGNLGAFRTRTAAGRK